MEMIIVDNGSRDESLRLITSHIDAKGYDWVDVIASSTNSGYATANNLALNHIRNSGQDVDFVWFLNPDTRPRIGAAISLVEFLSGSGKQIAGSRLEDDDGMVQVSHFNFPTPVSEFCSGARIGFLDSLLRQWIVTRRETNVPDRCDWVAGASMMISMDAIGKIGIMDEGYFLYYEELDYCLKASRLGIECWYVPQSRVCHLVGASTGISDLRKSRRRCPQYWFDSRRRFYLKNFGAVTLALADMAYAIGYSTWLIRKLLSERRELAKEPPHFLLDFVRNSFLFRGFML